MLLHLNDSMYCIEKTKIIGSFSSLVAVIQTFLLLWHLNVYWAFDCVVQLACYDYNKRANDVRRQRYNTNGNTPGSTLRKCPPYVACTIAYHESKETIQRLLDAYCKGSNRPKAFIVSVDGDSPEELHILDAFRSVSFANLLVER